MNMKPIHLCSTLNFGFLDNHGNPGSVGIVFLYKPGTDNLNSTSVGSTSSFLPIYLCFTPNLDF